MNDPLSPSPPSAPADKAPIVSGAMRAGWVVSIIVHAAIIAGFAVVRPAVDRASDFRFAAGAAAGEMVISLVEETPTSRQPVKKRAEAEAEPSSIEESLPAEAARVEQPVTIVAAPRVLISPPPVAAPGPRESMMVGEPMASSASPAEMSWPDVQPTVPTPSVTAPAIAGPSINLATAGQALPRQRRFESASAGSDAAHGIEAGELGITVPPPAYPRMSRLRGEQGVVVVVFDLLPSGVPANIRVVRSPGFERLSRAAVAAVKRARLPQPASGQTLTVRKEFHFLLR